MLRQLFQERKSLKGLIVLKFQYTTNCALLMMAYLASVDRIVTSREFEDETQFPQQSIFTAGRKLKKSGLINTVSGPFGGYVLAKPPGEISVQEILLAFDDAFSVGKELSAGSFTATTLSNLTKMLEEVKDDLDAKMSSYTLSKLIHPPIDEDVTAGSGRK